MATISDINAEVRALCDADTTDYDDTLLLRRINQAYEEVVGKIIASDGTWQFDDSNYTNIPEGTHDMIASQQDYSFDIRFLTVQRVEVLDINGIWHLLKPFDISQVTQAMSEIFKTPGMPEYYDKQGESIVLYPAPSAADTTLTQGLKVYYQRTCSLFTSAEVALGSKVPGFASPFHYILAYKAALPYCMTYKKDRVALYAQQAANLEKDLLAYYGKREKDKRYILKAKPIIHI